jgi:death on curing protein
LSGARQVDYLPVEDLLEIAAAILPTVSIRDAGLLASAAARPQTTLLGRDAYPSFAEKAAALMHSLARNHPLLDGNKRLAWAATRIFCLLNGRDLVFTVDDAEALVVATAAGELELPQLAAHLEAKLI